MEDSRYRLRVLHISDLHERGPREAEPWRRRRTLGDAWERNLAELLQDGPVDLVCFTGDAADWGLPEEYDAATSLFEAILDRLQVAKERLFLIPGNHDINRTLEADAWQSLRMALSAGVDSLAFSRWINGRGDAPPGIDPNWRGCLPEREAAYRNWVRQTLGRAELAPGGLGYRVTLQLPDWTFPIHILGLDTAWLCGDDSDAGRLHLTENQIMGLATREDGGPLEGLRLGLMHHPFHELADGAHCRRLIAGHVDLVLRGHLHEPEVETWVDPDRQIRQVAAGCLYEGHRADQYPNACELLTLQLDSAGRLAQIDLRFRAWSPRGGHWHDDDSLYRESRQGRLTWLIRQPQSPAAVANPYDPWTPNPDHFVGRIGLFRRLEAALEEGRSVSLVGDWRMGKTVLLHVWSRRVQERGRVVKFLNGEGPEGVSVSAFVRAITGLEAPDTADGAADLLNRWAEAVGRPGLPPVILVDETDGLIATFGHRFFERLRGMLGRIALVLASRQELDLLFQDLGGSPLANRLEIQWLGLLEETAAEALIHRGDGLLGPGDTDRMRRWAGRHPFYLQLMGRHLLDARRFGEGIEQAMGRFRTEASMRLRELWRVLDDKERQALKECLAGIPATRRSLAERGLVTGDGKLFGEVLAEWLREKL